MECLDANVVQDLMSGALDDSMRMRVLGHLDTCDECRELLSITARDTLRDHESLDETVDARTVPSAHDNVGLLETAMPASILLDSKPAATGPRLGRFVLQEKLGAGAMGVVWRAEDPELGRKIALKLLRRPDASLTERLVREAQSMAQVSHPNVVTVYDVGNASGQTYIAMELVKGQSLRAWQAAAQRTVPELVEVYIAAGRGLAAAHAAGIIHRDFKPDNVLVGDDGRIRVTDFGLAAAKPTAGAASQIGDVNLTTSGSVLGTPAYMAPEQFANGNIDPRTDQFNFCVALYEALYGERPFAGRTFEQLGDSVTAGKIQPPPAGARVSGALRAIVLRGLAVKPGDRFPTMDHLLKELGRDRARPWRRAAVAAVVVAAALAFTLGAEWVVRDRIEDGVQRSFALIGRQIDRAVDHLANQFDALSNQVYLTPVVREVSGHHDQADFGLGTAEDDRADLERVHEALAATDWKYARADTKQRDVLAIADYKGRLLYTTAAPAEWNRDLTKLPMIHRALTGGKDSSVALIRYDDPIIAASHLLGDAKREGVALLFTRALTLGDAATSLFLQIVDGSIVLDGIRLDKETQLALVAEDGTSMGDLPAALVARAPPSGYIEQVAYHGKTYVMQTVPLRAFDGRIVMALPVDSLVLSLFPFRGARIMFAVALLAALAIALATVMRARRIAN